MYGVAALRAAARGDRMMWALHRAALANGIVPVVPAPVVAEGFRTEVRGRLPAGAPGRLRGRGAEEEGAERLGGLAARAGTGDLVGASVAECAARRNAAVVAGRQHSLRTSSDLLGYDLVLYAV